MEWTPTLQMHRDSTPHGSIRSSTSLLRQSILSPSGRGGAQRPPRGGAAFQEACSPLPVGQPEPLVTALPAELEDVQCDGRRTDEGEVTLPVLMLTRLTTKIGGQAEAEAGFPYQVPDRRGYPPAPQYCT